MTLKDLLKLIDEDTLIIISYYNKVTQEEEEYFKGFCCDCPWIYIEDKLDTTDDVPPISLYTDKKSQKTYMQIYIL